LVDLSAVIPTKTQKVQNDAQLYAFIKKDNAEPSATQFDVIFQNNGVRGPLRLTKKILL